MSAYVVLRNPANRILDFTPLNPRAICHNASHRRHCETRD